MVQNRDNANKINTLKVLQPRCKQGWIQEGSYGSDASPNIWEKKSLK